LLPFHDTENRFKERSAVFLELSCLDFPRLTVLAQLRSSNPLAALAPELLLMLISYINIPDFQSTKDKLESPCLNGPIELALLFRRLPPAAKLGHRISEAIAPEDGRVLLSSLFLHGIKFRIDAPQF